MQHDAAEDLHVVVPHVLGAATRFATGGKRFGQNLVERFTFGQSCAELRRQFLQFFGAERLHLRFKVIDLGQGRTGGHGVPWPAPLPRM